MNQGKVDLSWIQLTNEFRNVLEMINNTKNNYFITGKAGTGKSTLLQYLSHTSKKTCVLLAPTGRAAINIEGQTLHSFFRLALGVIQADDYKENFISEARCVDIIIIDEISMVRADILDSIDKSLQYTMNKCRPFGGIQVIFFGDPYQLPPVVPKSEEVSLYFSEYYKSPYFFDSFVYDQSNFKVIELQKVFRQEDVVFINTLNKFRNDSYTDNDLSFINERVMDNIKRSDLKIVLTPYKAKAAFINNSELESIKRKERVFHASSEGKIKSSNVPAQEILKLKKGAQVMFVKNRGKDWVNGDLGIVAGFDKDNVVVKKNSKKHTVGKETWDDYCYQIDPRTKKISKSIIGRFTQIPLILAWAITIHKGQGTTLSGVHIDFDRGAFAYGQTYVAISRTRKITDMTLERPILSSDIRVDSRVNDYFSSIEFET
jgi:ATP-dependent exoDNAse (exonuclease V) alpha subunit